MSLNNGLDYERSLFNPLLNTKGKVEGVSAFLEKRKPDFNKTE